eukprot:3262686-Alexandrium_andersonii.AAC.1
MLHVGTERTWQLPCERQDHAMLCAEFQAPRASALGLVDVRFSRVARACTFEVDTWTAKVQAVAQAYRRAAVNSRQWRHALARGTEEAWA